MNIRAFSFFVLASVLALGAHAQVNVPNTFTSGSPASAAQVNANFHALASAINSIDSRLKSIEGSQALSLQELVGTYNLMMFGNGVSTMGVTTKRIAGTATIVAVQNGGYEVALSCSSHLQESGQNNFDYRPNADGTGAVSTVPFQVMTDDSCSGHLGVQLPIFYNATTRQVSIGGTQVVLMPVGKGLLIGGEGYRASNANGPETVSTVVMLVRK